MKNSHTHQNKTQKTGHTTQKPAIKHTKHQKNRQKPKKTPKKPQKTPKKPKKTAKTAIIAKKIVKKPQKNRTFKNRNNCQKIGKNVFFYRELSNFAVFCIVLLTFVPQVPCVWSYVILKRKS